MKETKLGGYAEKLPDNRVSISGFYGRRIVVPMDELDALVAEFNAEVWNPSGHELVGSITPRQITGSGGPSNDFCVFYMKKNNIDHRVKII